MWMALKNALLRRFMVGLYCSSAKVIDFGPALGMLDELMCNLIFDVR